MLSNDLCFLAMNFIRQKTIAAITRMLTKVFPVKSNAPVSIIDNVGNMVFRMTLLLFCVKKMLRTKQAIVSIVHTISPVLNGAPKVLVNRSSNFEATTATPGIIPHIITAMASNDTIPVSINPQNLRALVCGLNFL